MDHTESAHPDIVPANEIEQVYRPGVATPEYLLHWFLFGLGCAVLVMSLTMKSEGESSVYLPWSTAPMPEICSTRMLMGVDCPGCGLTRAFISISHGQLARAWQFNPASFFVYLFVIGQIPWQAYQLFRIWRGQYPYYSNWLYITPSLAAAALLIQWGIRLAL